MSRWPLHAPAIPARDSPKPPANRMTAWWAVFSCGRSCWLHPSFVLAPTGTGISGNMPAICTHRCGPINPCSAPGGSRWKGRLCHKGTMDEENLCGMRMRSWSMRCALGQ
ncbi:hypothetical protein ASPCADRAFT_131068 [Aspergillus carbonarius ITEM 5010]|uniref:Uncharacterized protein n=1 Tax=Aspergillus carbonarius (strain ITEM 5010) TaxID=602072 RepID=A0A1R3RMA1_ASPC5|nr:hypothetical protein ASPCADRAFT_131068 [Aspergillus carbonarius ITEM 5010]